MLKPLWSVATPTGFLAAPFEDVRFEWDISDRGIQLEYRGSADQLIASGAIEPHMVERREKPSPKPRLDSQGHTFQRAVSGLKSGTMKPVFLIKRWISDPQFASRLPGVARGLRCKRLDWLDARPGLLHVDSYDIKGGRGYVPRRHTRSAGTRDALVSAGFPKGIFPKLHRSFASRWFSNYGEDEDIKAFFPDDGTWITVTALMRGYYEVHAEVPIITKAEDPIAVECVRRPQLRLVVDNEVRP